MKEKFRVSGMSCSACSSRVEKIVKKIDGVQKVNVNLLTGTMDVEGENLDAKAICQQVTHGGYKTEHIMAKGQKKEHETSAATSRQIDDEARYLRIRLVLSLIFLVPLLAISMGPMLFGFHQAPYPMTHALIQLIFLVPIAFLNRHFFIRGVPAIFRGGANMDSLVSVGAGAAIVYGLFAIFRMAAGYETGDMYLVETYGNDIYLESAATILTLVTVGKYLELRSKGQTSKAIEKLMDLAPKETTVLRNGKEVVIDTDDLQLGDIMIVKPGERIAADGIIMEGSCVVDQSAITGESIPVELGAGDTVVSASINKSGYITVKTTKVGADTTINQIIALVEEASSSKAPIAKLADKIAGVFVPVVMAIGFITVVTWILGGASLEFALSMGISVLVISCPCALGLATPVAIMVGTGKAAENGIIIKSGEAFQVASAIDHVVLDKTGTITAGNPAVTAWNQLGTMDMEETIDLCRSIEKASEHPLAQAIVDYRKNEPLKPEEFQVIFGRGVKGKVAGKQVIVGNRSLMKDEHISCTEGEKLIEEFSSKGWTGLFAAVNGQLQAVIGLADVEKSTSAQAVEQFKKMGIKVSMLTGDNQVTAEFLANKLGIDNVIAQVLPQEKENKIRTLQEQGEKVAMVGDGINDGPALARADVGIAIGGGTDVAVESGDIVLMRDDLLDAVNAIKLSRSVLRNIKENLFWAFFYNVIAIPMAAGVFYPSLGVKLSPMISSLAMSMSSVCVVLNALRLKSFKVKSSMPGSSTGKEQQMKEYVLNIEGMMCGHCQRHVEKALTAVEGVSQVTVNLEEKNAVVSGADGLEEELKRAVVDAGYQVV